MARQWEFNQRAEQKGDTQDYKISSILCLCLCLRLCTINQSTCNTYLFPLNSRNFEHLFQENFIKAFLASAWCFNRIIAAILLKISDLQIFHGWSLGSCEAEIIMFIMMQQMHSLRPQRMHTGQKNTCCGLCICEYALWFCHSWSQVDFL